LQKPIAEPKSVSLFAQLTNHIHIHIQMLTIETQLDSFSVVNFKPPEKNAFQYIFYSSLAAVLTIYFSPRLLIEKHKYNSPHGKHSTYPSQLTKATEA